MAVAILSVLFLQLSGCTDDREKLTRMQAEVNRAATELVVQDAQARRDWVETQKRLDEERRELARQGRRDPIIAQAILQIGGITLALTPLVALVFLIWRGDGETDPPPVDPLVLDELIELRAPLIDGPAHHRYHDRHRDRHRDDDRDHDLDPDGGPPARGLPAPDLNALIERRLGRRDD